MNDYRRKKQSKKGTSKIESDDTDVVTDDTDVAADDTDVARIVPPDKLEKYLPSRISRPKKEAKKDSLIFSSLELSINKDVDGGENVVPRYGLDVRSWAVLVGNEFMISEIPST